MYIFKTIEPLQKYLRQQKASGKTVGFVPTMGALHEGHLELLRQAKRENNLTVCSIFVNPTQFNDVNDLLKYPRTIEQDIHLLNTVKTDVLFLPDVEAIYPPDLDTSIHLDVGSLDKLMEGEHRPGHFAGVMQVVKRLLDITTPDKLYMGQKDYQQFSICRFMIQALQLPVTIVMCPIVREKSGLAMSSRNLRLSDAQRQDAPKIYNILQEVARLSKNNSVAALKAFATAQLKAIEAFKLDYFEIADAHTLLTATDETVEKVACVAVFVGEVRLIDNVLC